MRAVLYVIAGCLLALAAQMLLGGGAPATRDTIEPPAPSGAGSDEDLEGRVDYLEGEVERLTAEVATLRADSDRAAIPQRPDDSASQPRIPNPKDGADLSARRYLTLYVQSFASNPKGSEYFRLAVDAWALDLVADLARVVRDPSRPLHLRVRLVMMLGTQRFRGNRTAITALIDATRMGPDAVAIAALRGLKVVGSQATATEIESLFADLEGSVRPHALDVIGALAGTSAGEAFLRLYLAATDAPTRAAILQRLPAGDPARTVKILRHAFAQEVAERTAAAHRLTGLYGDPFAGLVDEQLARERDPGVRKILEAAKKRMSTLPSYHPMQATGPPNAVAAKDDARAWTTQQANGGREWLEVGFERPLRVSEIRIYEVATAGAIAEVVVIDTKGRRHTVWKGVDPTKKPGVFSVPMTTTTFAVRGARIILDTSRANGWNEIDTVQLVGPDGSAWAKTATASGYYGAGRFR